MFVFTLRQQHLQRVAPLPVSPRRACAHPAQPHLRRPGPGPVVSESRPASAPRGTRTGHAGRARAGTLQGRVTSTRAGHERVTSCPRAPPHAHETPPPAHAHENTHARTRLGDGGRHPAPLCAVTGAAHGGYSTSLCLCAISFGRHPASLTLARRSLHRRRGVVAGGAAVAAEDERRVPAPRPPRLVSTPLPRPSRRAARIPCTRRQTGPDPLRARIPYGPGSLRARIPTGPNPSMGPEPAARRQGASVPRIRPG